MKDAPDRPIPRVRKAALTSVGRKEAAIDYAESERVPSRVRERAQASTREYASPAADESVRGQPRESITSGLGGEIYGCTTHGHGQVFAVPETFRNEPTGKRWRQSRESSGDAMAQVRVGGLV